MTNHTSANDFEDVIVPHEELVSALENEIGILSVDLVKCRLKLKSALLFIAKISEENTNLRLRVERNNTEIAELKDMVTGPNHPSRRAAKRTK